MPDGGRSTGADRRAHADLELTVLMPWLIEAETIGTCIRKARRAMRAHGVPARCDDSYDFQEIPKIIEKLREGYALVQACRLPAGGGTVKQGAMPRFQSRSIATAARSLAQGAGVRPRRPATVQELVARGHAGKEIVGRKVLFKERRVVIAEERPDLHPAVVVEPSWAGGVGGMFYQRWSKEHRQRDDRERKLSKHPAVRPHRLAKSG